MRNIYLVIITAITLTLISSIELSAQNIKIRTLNGSNEIINISHNGQRDIMLITTQRDTLKISNCLSIEEVKPLSEHFVMVIYQSRGGAGINIQYVSEWANRLERSIPRPR